MQRTAFTSNEMSENSAGIKDAPKNSRTADIYLFAFYYAYYRDCNISKKEWVLRGESVLYVSFSEIKRALQHDFDNEKEFSYKV